MTDGQIIINAGKMLVPSGWIRGTYQYLDKRFPLLYNEWKLANAEAMLSGACWKVKIIDQDGVLQPTVWVEITAPSGDGKTKTYKYVIKPTFFELERLMETDKERHILILEKFGSDAISAYFKNDKLEVAEEKNSKKLICNCATILQDEKTGIYKAIGNQGYLADYEEFLCELYDQSSRRKLTINRGIEGFNFNYNCYVAASTPYVYRFVTDARIIQGSVGRPDHLVFNPKPLQAGETLPELDEDYLKFDVNEVVEEQEKAISNFAADLKRLIDAGPIKIKFQNEASKMWRDYELEMRTLAYSLPEVDLRRPAIKRQAEHALKRAGLYTVSRYMHGLPNAAENGTLICTQDEMETAIKNQRVYLEHFYTFLDERKLHTINVENKTSNDATDTEILMAALKSMGGEWVSRQRLINQTSWKDGNTKWRILTSLKDVEGKVIQADRNLAIQLVENHKNDKRWLFEQDIKYPLHATPSFFKVAGDQN